MTKKRTQIRTNKVENKTTTTITRTIYLHECLYYVSKFKQKLYNEN